MTTGRLSLTGLPRVGSLPSPRAGRAGERPYGHGAARRGSAPRWGAKPARRRRHPPPRSTEGSATHHGGPLTGVRRAAELSGRLRADGCHGERSLASALAALLLAAARSRDSRRRWRPFTGATGVAPSAPPTRGGRARHELRVPAPVGSGVCACALGTAGSRPVAAPPGTGSAPLLLHPNGTGAVSV